MVLFAFSIPSAGVLNVKTDKTGPNISSRAIRCDWETPVNIVGGYQKPLLGNLHSGDQRLAPSVSPVFEISCILFSCSFELIAPRSVFLSIGSPTLIKLTLFFNFSSTSSAIFSCSNNLEPAQQTCP